MKKLFTLAVAVCVSAAAIAQTQIIAHRGFHTTDGSCRNSIAALKEAQKLGIYGEWIETVRNVGYRMERKETEAI